MTQGQKKAYGLNRLMASLEKDLRNAPENLGLTDKKGQAERSEMLQTTMDELQNIDLPELERIQGTEWQEDLTYDPIAVQEMGPSAFDSIDIDPRLQSDQYAALDSLANLAQSGGMNAQDEANLARIQNQTATADKGRRDAIQQNMQQRGMGGSGLELLQQLQSNQAATNRQAQQGLDVAGMGQDRALQAIQMGAGMAGNMQSQQFGQQAQQAQANDALSRFNAGQRTTNRQWNSDRQQNTDKFNIQGRQGAAESANQADQYNKTQLPQAGFDNQMEKWTGGAQARGHQVGMAQANSAENSKANAEVAGGLIKGAVKLFS